MRTLRLVGLALACSALTAAVPRAAHAQTPSELAAAQRWFAEGLAFEGSGHWKDALERFRRVAAVKHTAQVDFHVGLGEEHVGELVAATVDLRRALDAATSQHVTNVERAATAELEQLRPRVPHLQIVVPPSATIARVVLDDRSIAVVALGEPIALDPGTHVVVVSFASGGGTAEVTRNVTLQEREAQKLQLEPPANQASAVVAPAASAPPVTSTDTGTRSASSGGSNVLGWTLVGAGGAAVIGGAVFWALRGHEVSTLDAACGAGGAHCPDSVHSDYTTGKAYSAVSVALFATGAAVVGTGVVWLLTHGHGSDSSGHDAQLAPVFFPGGGGASCAARF